MDKFTPGTTLALITEEYELMEHMQEILSKKLQLDRHYVKHLRLLVESINPKCREGAIGSLLDPMINLFDNEIQHRVSTCELIAECMVNLPERSPDRPNKDDIRPSSFYQPLGKCYQEAKKRHDVARSPESVLALQSWYHHQINRTWDNSWWSLSGEPQLPKIDRHYRRAVCVQQAAVEAVASWHDAHIPELLERHQNNAEFLKKQFRRIFNSTSNLYATLVPHCSVAIDAIDTFSPLSFVAPKHEICMEERDHVAFKPFIYHNYWLNGKEAPTPLFGTTRERFQEAISAIADIPPDRLPQQIQAIQTADFLDRAIEVERLVQNGTSIYEAVKQSNIPRKYFFEFTLLNYGFLLPISEANIVRYKGGVPRRKIGSLLPDDDFSLRLFAKIAELDVNCSGLDFYLTGSTECFSLIRDIFIKWDFKNNCPFPEGVARRLGAWGNVIHPEVIVTKTGERYSPTAPTG